MPGLKSKKKRSTIPLYLLNFNSAKSVRLYDNKVLVIGCGSHGTTCLLQLAAADVGHIGICDDSIIKRSDLNAQITFDHDAEGQLKAIKVRDRIEAINPQTKVVIYYEGINQSNLRDIISLYDIVVDASCSSGTSLLVSDICLTLNKPVIWAGITGGEGHLCVFRHQSDIGDTFTFRDLGLPFLKHEAQMSEMKTGILSTLPGIVGAMQASEVLKLMTQTGEVISGLVFTIDTFSNRITRHRLKPQPRIEGGSDSITPDKMKEMLLLKEKLFLIDVREKGERDRITIGGINIPLRQLPQQFEIIPHGFTLICYCRSGKRSQWAASYLKDQGHVRVFWLENGLRKLSPEVLATLSELSVYTLNSLEK